MTRDSQSTLNRRTYLKLTGAGGAAAIAGCMTRDGDGNGGGNGGGNGDGTATETGNGDGGESRVVIPGTAPGFPPFEMKQDGELVGFDVDLLTAVVEQTDYDLGDWEEFEFASLIPALENENIDVIAAALSIDPERDETIDFTDPYYDANQAVLVSEGGDFQPESFDDFEGRTVGAQEGTTGASTVEDELIEPGTIPEADFSRYGNYVLAVEDLVNGNIDAIVLDVPVAETFADQREVEVAFEYETGEQYAFGVRQGDDDFREALNEGLATVQEDGTFDDLVEEWFGSDGGEGGDGNETDGNETDGNETETETDGE